MTVAALRPPEASGMGRGLALALLAHGLLILALSYGLNWHSDSSPAFEAELWSVVPQVAAPREEAPPEPEPEAPKPEVNPDPKPDLKAAQQRAEREAAEAAEQREAEIAIAKEKKRKEEKAREEAAREKEAKEKAAKDKATKEKAARDKAEKEELERKKAKDAKAAKDAKEAKEAKDADARREALRQENLRRIQGMAGGTPGSAGTAAQNAGPSAGWIGRVRAAVKRSVNFPGITDTANPMVEVRVFLAVDGQILGRKVTRPSANAAWDAAVLRGIDSLGRVPLDDRRLPEYLDLTLRPHDELAVQP